MSGSSVRSLLGLCLGIRTVCLYFFVFGLPVSCFALDRPMLFASVAIFWCLFKVSSNLYEGIAFCFMDSLSGFPGVISIYPETTRVESKGKLPGS